MGDSFEAVKVLSIDQRNKIGLEPRPEFSLDMMLFGIAVYVVAIVAMMIFGSTLIVVAVLPMLTLAAAAWVLGSWTSKRWSDHCYQLIEESDASGGSLVEYLEQQRSEWSTHKFNQHSKYATFTLVGLLLIMFYTEIEVGLAVAFGYLLTAMADFSGIWGLVTALAGIGLILYLCSTILMWMVYTIKATSRNVFNWVRHVPFDA